MRPESFDLPLPCGAGPPRRSLGGELGLWWAGEHPRLVALPVSCLGDAGANKQPRAAAANMACLHDAVPALLCR